MFSASNTEPLSVCAARIAAFATTGWLVCWLPALLQSSTTFWGWNALSAMGLAWFGAARASRGTSQHSFLMLIMCPLALCLALSTDFSRCYPEAVLNLCGQSFSLNAWILHTRFFPLTTATMLMLSILTLPGDRERPGELAWRIVDQAASAAVMLIAMEISAMLLQRWSRLAHWPWTANGLVCAMLLGMTLYHLTAQTLRQRVFTGTVEHART